MTKITVHEKKIICQNPQSPFCYFAWPTVKRLPDGTLITVCSGFRLKHVCAFGKVIATYSRDEGKTWSAPAILIDTPLDDRDAGIGVFGDGSVLVTSFNNSIAFQRSYNALSGGEHAWYDEGKKKLSNAYLDVIESTEGAEEKYLGSLFAISRDGGYSFGPIAKIPISAPHGPSLHPDGDLRYVGSRFDMENPASPADADPRIQCYRISSDGTFEHLGNIPDIYREGKRAYVCEPHCICLPDGKIVVHIRVHTEKKTPAALTIYQSISTDGGYTFSAPVQISGDCGGAPAHLCLAKNGDLISAYGYREKPFGIRLMISRDGAKTWETDLVLDDEGETHDLGYPATVELSDGRFLTVYYEKIGDQSIITQKIWSYE